MTYSSQNSGSHVAGANAFLRPFIGNGLLAHDQLYGGIDAQLSDLFNGTASSQAIAQLGGGQAYEANLTVENYAVKVVLSATGMLDAYVDYNANGNFCDAGEKAIAGFDLRGFDADWQVKVGSTVAPQYDSGTSLSPGVKKESIGSDSSLTPGVKKESIGSDNSLKPGSKPEPVVPPAIPPAVPPAVPPVVPPAVPPAVPPVVPPVAPPPPPFVVPGPGSGQDVPPIFVVPQAPTVVANVPGAVVGAIDIIDPDTFDYQFFVLDGTQSADGQRVLITALLCKMANCSSIL
ncbi:MAG: hypothetical protein HC805_02250 [Alkalinema sp. RL_2_19]|nr:hypothetical protein [Alkalinema sp. RL_2_19]